MAEKSQVGSPVFAKQLRGSVGAGGEVAGLEADRGEDLDVAGKWLGQQRRQAGRNSEGFRILLAEGLGAFLVVGGLVGIVTGNWPLAMLLGAIASATAPAATVNVKLHWTQFGTALPALPGEKPTLKDWEDHLTTAFPEVRLKRFLEMRGADGGPWRRICALPALWAGLLYHRPSLDAAWDIARDWNMEERIKLRSDVPRLSLDAEVRGRTVRDSALEVIELAHLGLTARGRMNTAGDNETGFLSPLQDVAERNETPAERKLKLYHGDWKESVDPLFFECAY